MNRSLLCQFRNDNDNEGEVEMRWYMYSRERATHAKNW